MISFDLQSTLRNEYLGLIAEELKQGKIAILPTSTMYGISCCFDNAAALKKVYEIKKRPKDLPFIVLLPDISDIDIFVEEISGPAKILIEKYWSPIPAGTPVDKYDKKAVFVVKDPGRDINKNSGQGPDPLTLVFKRKKTFGKQNNLPSTKETIALRIDPLGILGPILKICGPVISTSATISGAQTSPKRIGDIDESIKKKVDIAADLGFDLPGKASTILDVTGSIPILLREGKLKFSKILDILGIQ